ncbi:MAG: hypothetical protein ACT4OF_03420 [Caulobacteraceae bacterium]
MFRPLMFAAALVVCASPAFAQDDEEEIVVTGSRLQIYDGWAVPHTFITRRADFGVVEVEVRNDTRAADARRTEMIDALRRLEAGARRAGMTLVIVDDDIGLVRPYTQAAAELLIGPGQRSDTSYLVVRLRTPVTANDTLETIHQRVERLVADTPKPGRVEMTVDETDLSMVNLEQYRGEMLRAILAEGRDLARDFGGAQAVELGGLESQVAFKRTGDLDLVLFLPYTLTASLAAQP